jgi:hypothetical protein
VEIDTGSIAANGTTLYYELRGGGPPLLFISGATGDAGHWTEVADALAGEYGEGMATGGPPMATELFLRWVAGDETFESLDPDFRDRMLNNGEVLFGLELESVIADNREHTARNRDVDAAQVVPVGSADPQPSALRDRLDRATGR